MTSLRPLTVALATAAALILQPSGPADTVAADAPTGFAAVNALGQNGTTGGAGGRTVTATNAEQFLEYIDSLEPLIIQVSGRIEITSKQGVRPNKTIVGVGTTGHITGGGLDFYRSYNVIVRNLRFTDAEDDAVNIGQNSHHIWIDHNTFSGAVDGSVDVVRGADYVTVSWNHFDHSDKSMLISHSDGAGGTDIGHLKVTIHHNFFDNSRQRHPRIRFGEPVHIYNNYFLGNELYGVASTENAGAVVEGNYFENVPHPLFSAGGYADSGPGRAVQRNNIFVNSGTPEVAGTVVEPRTYYGYTVDAPQTVPATVRAGAGVGKIIPTATTATTATGARLVVAPGGDDAAPGTIDRPLATIQRAIDLAQPGTVILIRRGTYALTTNLQILKSGTAAAPITLSAYPGEKVLIDGEPLPHTPAPVGGSIPNSERGAIHMEAAHWRISGLEIANGPYGIFCRACDDNVFDRLVTRDNYESGLHIQGASAGNLVLNLDSYGNRDPRKNGESADGLAIKEGSGAGNVVRGARLWNNSDDGFDAWEFLSPITIEGSVAYGNGFNRWDLPDYTGDGNGFKLGGGDEDLPAAHVVRGSMAFRNQVGGFIDNANPGALALGRNTAWRNGGTGFDLADATATLSRNLSASNGTAVALGSSSTGSGNSWDLGGTWNDASLVSTDPSILTGPRRPDGGLRSSSFLRPRNGADLGARL
ncbi:right-handed parallel beta-helix repeat-containing protein [Nonomuraea sp. NPDC050404]|uniref:pectate lyase family protein n=1 Tax=Nonomuraea sp. NPDC050404 TaxID=3155783 RepID=UPI0033DDAA3C